MSTDVIDYATIPQTGGRVRTMKLETHRTGFALRWSDYELAGTCTGFGRPGVEQRLSAFFGYPVRLKDTDVRGRYEVVRR